MPRTGSVSVAKTAGLWRFRREAAQKLPFFPDAAQFPPHR